MAFPQKPKRAYSHNKNNNKGWVTNVIGVSSSRKEDLHNMAKTSNAESFQNYITKYTNKQSLKMHLNSKNVN